jgi:hypothetical protein
VPEIVTPERVQHYYDPRVRPASIEVQPGQFDEIIPVERDEASPLPGVEIELFLVAISGGSSGS